MSAILTEDILTGLNFIHLLSDVVIEVIPKPHLDDVRESVASKFKQEFAVKARAKKEVKPAAKFKKAA